MKKLYALPLAALALMAACEDGSKGLLEPTMPEIGGPLKDIISLNGSSTLDPVAKLMALNIGTNGTTTLYTITESRADEGLNGEGGCNFKGSNPVLTVGATSSNPAVATVTQSVTMTKGSDSCSTTPTITVTPVSEGETTISFREIERTGDVKGNFTFTSFTVRVAAPSNTAPRISIAGVTGGASYNKGSVPAATCQVTDAEDGSRTFAATLSAITGAYASDGIGSQAASCVYTDRGGLEASSSVTYAIVDPSAPGISSLLSPAAADGLNGWYKSNVSLAWTVTENESPNSLQKTGCVDQNITADQAATSYSCSASSAGGSAGPMSVSIKRDATAPTVGGSLSSGATLGWHNAPVTVSFTGTDATSGVASCTAEVTFNTEGANQQTEGTCTDYAGNVSGTQEVTVNIDRTAPTVAFTSATPAANANGWYNTDVTATFTATDELSGFGTTVTSSSRTATQNVTSSGEGEGVVVRSPAFADKAGNTAAVGAAHETFNIDKTAPVVRITGVTDGGTYTLGAVPTAGCSTTDALSGVGTEASLSRNGGTVGSITVTCSGAADKAGNQQGVTATATYSVVYARTAFLEPIPAEANYLNRTFKAGSTIPVKFQLRDATGAIITNAVAKISFTKESSATGGDTPESINLVADSGNTFRYSVDGQQYIFNLATTKLQTGTFRITATLNDGTTISQPVVLK